MHRNIARDTGERTIRPPAPRIALVVGDTAGHAHPALAVADAMRASDPGTQIIFLGTTDSIAASIVRQAGQPFEPVPGRPFRGASLAGLARAAWSTAASVARSRRTLAQHGSELALGFGAFATPGVLLAARTLGLRTAILEANVEFGLANRWLRPWVDHVFRGLDAPARPGAGVPVRASIASLGQTDRQPPHGAIRVLVSSGSRGDEFFAERLPQALALLAGRGIRVQIHQQAADAVTLRDRYAALGIDATVEPFISDIGAAYAWADVAIGRAGASTVAELAISGVPALLVPLATASANHQAANAALWQRAGGGPAIVEQEWTAEAAGSWLRMMACDAAAWTASARAARTLARPGAATEVAAACMRMIRNGATTPA